MKVRQVWRLISDHCFFLESNDGEDYTDNYEPMQHVPGKEYAPVDCRQQGQTVACMYGEDVEDDSGNFAEANQEPKPYGTLKQTPEEYGTQKEAKAFLRHQIWMWW